MNTPSIQETTLIFYTDDNGKQTVIETYFPDELIRAFRSHGFKCAVTPF